jgi:hypothetical protein
MSLATAVAQEAEVDLRSIMLLRHANGKVDALLAHGASIEEYTLLQPTDSKYDFHATGRRQVNVVAVVVKDKLHAIYAITGVKRAGTTHSLASGAFLKFDKAMHYQPRSAKLFSARELSSEFIGRNVENWSSPRNAVARFNGKLFKQVSLA